MSKNPFSKLQSSLSLEDLLDQPSPRNSQNWLLTYLDVFVLIVMLVITLITLSDINTEQQQAAANKSKKAPTLKCPPVVAPVAINCPPPVAVETKPAQQIASTEYNLEINPIISGNKTDPKESNSIAASTNTPEISIAAGVNTIPKPTDAKQTAVNLADENQLPPNSSDIETEANSIPQPTDTQPAAVNPADENNLQQQLTKTIDEFGLNKAVNIKVTRGYAQLEIQDKVLFKSSEADLTTSGEALIKRLTPLLKQAVGLILIEGHTDNIPIKTPQFPSNWELGSSRAASVLHFLVSQQLDSGRLRATTYADTMPIADNSTPEGREKNRRVNILIKFSEQ